jgi:hypothetical protein
MKGDASDLVSHKEDEKEVFATAVDEGTAGDESRLNEGVFLKQTPGSPAVPSPCSRDIFSFSFSFS